jgi:hypothetical protein
MAEETEVIVTKFTADLTDLEKGVTEYEATLGGAAKASDNLDKSTKNLGASVGQLSPKFEAIKQSAQRTASAVAAVGTETKKAGASGGALSKLQGAFASIRTSVGNVASSANSFFGEVVKGASTAAPGLSNITGLFGGMVNPITVAAAAVVGFIANFSRLDSVQVYFDSVGIGFDIIGNRLANLDFKGLMDPQTQQRDIEFAARMAAALDAVADVQLKINKQNAEAELQLAGLNQQLRDRTKTEAERLAIADQITSIENNRAKEEEGFIRGRIKLQEELNAKELESLGEVSDANKKALSDLQVELLNSQRNRVQLIESTERRVNSIVEQGAAERAAAEQKAEAARAKAVAEAARRRQVIETNEKTLQETLDRLAQEQVDRTATEAEREVNIVTRKYADIESKTKEGFAKIREVTDQSGQAELAQQEAEAIVQITEARDAELADLEKKRADLATKTREEQLEQVRQSLLSETEQKREAILVQLDLDRAAAEASIANVEERNATIAALTAKAEQDLSLIVSEEQAKRLEQEKQAQAQQQALLQENAQIATDFAVASAELIGQVAAGNEDVAKNAAKVLTTLLLDTLEKIILANAFQVQAISAGAPDPANVATGGTLGITRGLILAGIVKALFAAAKSAIAGAYTGEERVGMGEAPLWQGRDGYLRRVHKNEGIVDAETNLAFLPHINAMRKGRKAYDDLIYREHIAPAIQALGHGDMSTVNEFVRSDFGNRVVTSSMLPKNYDRNIVGELRSSRREGRQQTELLAEVVKQLRPNRSRW